MSSGHTISHQSDPARSLLRPLLLCIDDDEVLLECKALLLQKHGHRTLFASGGLAGAELFIARARFHDVRIHNN